MTPPAQIKAPLQKIVLAVGYLISGAVLGAIILWTTDFLLTLSTGWKDLGEASHMRPFFFALIVVPFAVVPFIVRPKVANLLITILATVAIWAAYIAELTLDRSVVGANIGLGILMLLFPAATIIFAFVIDRVGASGARQTIRAE